MIEPKSFKIKKLSLWGLFQDSNGKPFLTEIQKLKSARSYTLQESVGEISKTVDELEGSRKSNLIMPVYCIGNIDPMIAGTKSFLAANIPETLKTDIQSLKLYRPIETKFSSGKNETGALLNTIIDFSYHKILIIGNCEKAIDQLKTILDTFFFPDKNPRCISNDLHYILTTYISKPAGSKVLVGGFGAIFAFLFAFIVNKCLALSLSFGELFSFILCLFSIVCFLTLEAFEENIIAFASRWVIKFIVVGWLLFLLVLFTSPLIIFGNINLISFLPAFRVVSLAILFVCLARTLGSVFFNHGITKKPVLLLWFTVSFFIILLPVIDN